MVKIFVNKENSGWIFDNIYSDYVKFSKHDVVGLKDNPDICWFLNPWGFPSIAKTLKCPSFVSVHHIDESKISKWNFDVINRFATGCIVPNIHTENMIRKYVKIPIYRFPYWLLSKMMEPKGNRVIETNGEILIGSFQKDSEGNTNKPKLSKGPDIFLEVVSKLKMNYNLKVILTGYNRGYIVQGLKNAGIPFVYKERVKKLNNIYDSIDWYFVTSRTEGGPQAILEASYRKVKILSTDVGMASEVLHNDCICKGTDEFVSKFNNVNRVDYNYKSALNYLPDKLISRLDTFFDKGYK